MLTVSFTSASSAASPGMPTIASYLANPIEFAAAPFASGVPTVSVPEV